MAITTALFGPNERMPNYAKGEWSWLRVVGAGTQVIVAGGAGVLGRVIIGAAGTRAQFFDCVSGGTADDTTMILNLPINSLVVPDYTILAPFDQGLTVITTGSSTDLTIFFNGRAARAATRAYLG